MIDVTVYVGGLYSSVYLIGFAFTISFSYNLMLSSLIRKLYFFRGRFPEEKAKREKKRSKKKGKGPKTGQKRDIFSDTDSDGNSN